MLVQGVDAVSGEVGGGKVIDERSVGGKDRSVEEGRKAAGGMIESGIY